jgi:hypothetical protein
MSELLTFLAESEKYCCGYSLLKGNAHVKTGALALLLGVHRRTIAYWRTDLREGAIAPCPECSKQAQNRPLR